MAQDRRELCGLHRGRPAPGEAVRPVHRLDADSV